MKAILEGHLANGQPASITYLIEDDHFSQWVSIDGEPPRRVSHNNIAHESEDERRDWVKRMILASEPLVLISIDDETYRPTSAEADVFRAERETMFEPPRPPEIPAHQMIPERNLRKTAPKFVRKLLASDFPSFWPGNHTWLQFDGDVTLNETQLAHLRDEHRDLVLCVDGHLTVHGHLDGRYERFVAWVSGDLKADLLSPNPLHRVRGRIDAPENTLTSRLERLALGWPPCRVLTAAELPQHFRSPEGDDDVDEARVFFFIDGDLHTNKQALKQFADEFLAERLCVNGDLHTDGRLPGGVWVGRDAHCDTYSSGWRSQVLGTIYARHYASLSGEDHESMHEGPPLRLVTPYVLTWYYDLSNVQMPADTIVFLQQDWDLRIELTNPHFVWREAVHALRPELCYTVHDLEASDADMFNHERIDQTLRAGQSIFRDGFSVESMALLTQAEAAYTGAPDTAEQAFDLFHRAAQAFPTSYLAYLGMGNCLEDVGAFDTALAYFAQAMAWYPDHQRLRFEAAESAARCALRCRRLDDAQAFARRAIEQMADDPGRRLDEARAYGWRLLGEALCLQGRLSDAQEALERAVALDDTLGGAYWLLGWLEFQHQRLDRAQQFQAKAKKIDADFAAPYEDWQSTDFVSAARATAPGWWSRYEHPNL